MPGAAGPRAQNVRPPPLRGSRHWLHHHHRVCPRPDRRWSDAIEDVGLVGAPVLLQVCCRGDSGRAEPRARPTGTRHLRPRPWRRQRPGSMGAGGVDCRRRTRPSNTNQQPSVTLLIVLGKIFSCSAGSRAGAGAAPWWWQCCFKRLHQTNVLRDLFVECYRSDSSEPMYQHWPAVNTAYGVPGQCNKFAKVRDLGEGADGEVGLYTTVPSGEPLSCRVFVAKSYKYCMVRQGGWADWAVERTEHMRAQAEHELKLARSLYCCGTDPLFPPEFFAVKVIKGQHMFCQPYFEPIPLQDREAALKQMPDLLKRFTAQGLGYSFKANEVHWRHFLKYMDGDVVRRSADDAWIRTRMSTSGRRRPVECAI